MLLPEDVVVLKPMGYWSSLHQQGISTRPKDKLPRGVVIHVVIIKEILLGMMKLGPVHCGGANTPITTYMYTISDHVGFTTSEIGALNYDIACVARIHVCLYRYE